MILEGELVHIDTVLKKKVKKIGTSDNSLKKASQQDEKSPKLDKRKTKF